VICTATVEELVPPFSATPARMGHFRIRDDSARRVDATARESSTGSDQDGAEIQPDRGRYRTPSTWTVLERTIWLGAT
jgi:hypothetical protein